MRALRPVWVWRDGIDQDEVQVDPARHAPAKYAGVYCGSSEQTCFCYRAWLMVTRLRLVAGADPVRIRLRAEVLL